MAGPRRLRGSGTYEIEELVGVNLETLEITYRTAAAYQPITSRLKGENTPAARQLLQAMADSIKVGNNGDAYSGWESGVTVDQGFKHAKALLSRLYEQGCTDFSSDQISVPLLRHLYQPFTSPAMRSSCWLLARVVKDNHPNGNAISIALRNTRFRTEESNPFSYDEVVADAIEAAARAVYYQRVEAQREIIHHLGHDTSTRSWMRIPASEIIDQVRRSHPEVTKPQTPQPSLAADKSTQIAWALTHGEHFGYQKHKHESTVLGPVMKDIGHALYPDNLTIVAAAILHCLGENSGFNFSVILQKDADALTYLGPDYALEHNVKSRAKLEDTRPTRLTSIYTPGGVVESLSGLTRFSRHARLNLLKSTGARATVANRLYVEHSRDPEDATVITSDRFQQAWRHNPAWDSHWPVGAGPRNKVPIRMAALRLVAQRRAMAEGVKADVHGHSERIKTHYSAHVLPDHVFNKYAIAAQDSFHDVALESFKFVSDATDGPAGVLASTSPDQIMDVEIGLCVSNGMHPDDQALRCGLGIVACFTCPNGYRTVDHIPGLLAAVELGNIIERNDPVEWEEGQASALRFLAQACLDKFPPMVVGNVRRSTDLVSHILTVTGMYMELRNG
jgi:hypothetical protein